MSTPTRECTFSDWVVRLRRSGDALGLRWHLLQFRRAVLATWRGRQVETIGVLGGMSSVASGEYYRRINEAVNAHRGGHTAAELVLYSVDFGVIEGFIREEQWDRAAEYLAERAQRLGRAGADFLILATNAMHRVAVELQNAIGIPLIHIVDATADTAAADGANTLGLLRHRARYGSRLLPGALC